MSDQTPIYFISLTNYHGSITLSRKTTFHVPMISVEPECLPCHIPSVTCFNCGLSWSQHTYIKYTANKEFEFDYEGETESDPGVSFQPKLGYSFISNVFSRMGNQPKARWYPPATEQEWRERLWT